MRVVNIARPIELIELLDQQASTGQLIELYETALQQFEQQNFQASASTLAEMFKQHPHDGPALVLLKRVVTSLLDGPDNTHPDWPLEGK